MTPAIQMQGVQFSYPKQAPILDIPELTIESGERFFLHGSSGSGKSTLLGIVTGILQPQKGSVRLFDHDVTRMKSRKRDLFRGTHIGYVFQQFNLIPYLNVLENICLPLRFARGKHALKKDMIARATYLADALSISTCLNFPVHRLSVGQQQRVAVARALINSPKILIADEPTSALDHDLRQQFLTLLFEVCSETQITILFVSHDLTLRSFFSTHVSLNKLNNRSTSCTS